MSEQNLPAPPVPPDCDLRKYNRMPLDIVRLRGSDIHVECTAEEKWFALELWMASFHQVPASSLPDDDAKLAYLAGLGRDKRTWNRVKKAALRGFSKHADGRLYHPVMADICLTTWETMRSRKRGASITNEARWNTQATDNKQNQSRSPSHSIYSERTLTETPSDRSPTRSAVATEGKDIPSPLPPSLPQAGTGSVEPHPPRPSERPKAIKDPEIDVGGGVILAINAAGICDLVTAPRDAIIPDFKTEDAKALRDKALGKEPATVTVLKPTPAPPIDDQDHEPDVGPRPDFMTRKTTAKQGAA